MIRFRALAICISQLILDYMPAVKPRQSQIRDQIFQQTISLTDETGINQQLDEEIDLLAP